MSEETVSPAPAGATPPPPLAPEVASGSDLRVLHVPVKLAARPRELDLAFTDAVALPPGYTLADAEKWASAPRRLVQHVKLRNLADFLAYIARYKNPDSLVLIAPNLTAIGTGEALATATLDYHHSEHAGAGMVAPRFGSHVVSLHPTPSPAYALLCAMDGKIVEQDVFAQQLRDLTRFCTSHPAAELLEIVRTLTLSSSGEYQSHTDDVSGSVRFRYQVQVDARAGTTERTLTVPTSITFRVPVFIGDKTATEIGAEYLYRPPAQSGGKVRMGIRMPERLWLENELMERTADKIREATGLLVAVGTK